MNKITVVGAGFSGLTLARECLKRGLAVEIVEKNSVPGGLIGTLETAHGLVETGAPSLNRTARVEKLFEELGVAVAEPAPTARKRLFYVGRLTSWPLSFVETLKMAVSFLRVRIQGPPKPRPGETIAQWGHRVLGSTATSNLLAPALQGIYAGDIERMSASLVLSGLFRKDREKFRGVIGARGGSLRLIEALEKDVLRRGGVIRYGVSFQEFPANPCVLTVSPSVAADLLEGRDGPLARRLRGVRMEPLIAVTAFYNSPPGPKAFGCLVARGHGLRVLGVLLNHAIFPDRDLRPSETWIFGGATDPEILSLDDRGVLEVLKAERRTLFGRTESFVDAHVVRWRRALPQYDLVLEDLLRDMREPEGVFLHGNWLGGIGLSKILERSAQLADRLAIETVKEKK